MSKDGIRMTPQEIFELALTAFDEADARLMTMIALPESEGGNPAAVGDGGSSIGLWQINKVHFETLAKAGLLTGIDQTVLDEIQTGLETTIGYGHPDRDGLWDRVRDQLKDPATNLRAALFVGWHEGDGPVAIRKWKKKGFDFTQWSAFNNESYKTIPNEDNDIMYGTEWAGQSPEQIVTSLVVDGSAAGDPIGSLPVDDGLREGSYVNPKDATTWGWDDDFGERMRWAAEYGDIDFQVVAGRMYPGEVAALRQKLGPTDPMIASVLSQTQFPEGRAAIVGYRTEEDAHRAPVFLRRFGLTTHPDYPFLITPVGANRVFDAGKDILEQLGDWAMGSLFDRRNEGMSEEQRLENERSVEGTNYE
jgi:hypothetical protein